MAVPRSEYPRPQFVRKDWLCLNGTWQFEIDQSDSGLERGMLERELKDTITVPFCPESKLSGVGHTDFINACWYRRTIEIPWSWEGQRILLHFGAVDYDTFVWVNGQEVARHRGGFTPFSADLSYHGVQAGQTITIIVRARDDRRGIQPRGKQCPAYASRTCHYTRTTGIWQTVWLEPVPNTYMKRPRITPDVANSTIRVDQPIACGFAGLKFRATLKDKKGSVAVETIPADIDFSPQVTLTIPESRRKLWEPGKPFLYDLVLELIDRDGQIIDRVESYAGLRSIAIEGKAVKINGKSIFQRLVLDQGYYPDGIMTAPSDEALKKDIELSLAAGFNGARLHQKVFEERFLYHADKMGYLVWGEFPDWGAPAGGESRYLHMEGADNHGLPMTYLTQWLEALHRDYSHPSIIGWCGLNETIRGMSHPNEKYDDRINGLDDATRGMFLAAKALDSTRPVLDASGYTHRVVETDIYDCHSYTQDPQQFADQQAPLKEGAPFRNGKPETMHQVPYRGQPFFVSEFGGTWWNPAMADTDGNVRNVSWGYGNRPKTLAEFYDRVEKLFTTLLDDPNMFGYCYTQLTDVEQEQNGIYLYDRNTKFDVERIRKVQQRTAAIEKK